MLNINNINLFIEGRYQKLVLFKLFNGFVVGAFGHDILVVRVAHDNGTGNNRVVVSFKTRDTTKPNLEDARRHSYHDLGHCIMHVEHCIGSRVGRVTEVIR